jgi:hypothetical protein
MAKREWDIKRQVQIAARAVWMLENAEALYNALADLMKASPPGGWATAPERRAQKLLAAAPQVPSGERRG